MVLFYFILLLFIFSIEKKVLVTQSSTVLCHAVAWNMPGSSVHGIFQAGILMLLLLSGLLFPSLGDLPDPGIEPGSPEFAGRLFTL